MAKLLLRKKSSQRSMSHSGVYTALGIGADARRLKRQVRPKFRRRVTPPPPERIGIKWQWTRAKWMSLSVLLICGGLLYWFGSDDRLFVERIVVSGNAAVPTEEIAQAAQIQHWNVFFLRQDEIEERVRAVDGVSHASARYELPNTIHLQVVERKPVFVWESQKRSVWVDEQGRTFAMRGTNHSLLWVRDMDVTARPPLTQLDMRLVTAVLALTAALPQVRQLDYSATKGLTFVHERGWRVLLGQPDQMPAKLAMLEALAAYLQQQKIAPEYVDVRLPERAFYKPR